MPVATQPSLIAAKQERMEVDAGGQSSESRGADSRDDDQDESMRDDNEEDDEEAAVADEANGDSADDGVEESVRNRKRKRNGEVVRTSDYEPRNKPKRDADGFVAGSVVRVALSHFVTYDAVELFPGPHLNMIIGPNGTGKSTIVCAIALGLGWKTGVLGRASDAASFVKKGYEDAWIEIELKGKPGQANTTVKRTLSRRNNASDWYLNGKKVPQKDVADVVEGFNIQINNLCTFLPQEKVADFAKMTPPALLRETQRAAGDDRLQIWHDKLIENGKEKARLEEKMSSDRKEKDKLSTQNEALASDVRAFEERKRVEDRLEVLKIERPFAMYKKTKQSWQDAKAERDEKKRQFKEREGNNAPMASLKTEQENYLEKCNLRAEKASKSIKSIVSEQKKRMDQIRSMEKKFEEQIEERDQLSDQVKLREKRISDCREKIRGFEEIIASKPDKVDTSRIDAELRDIAKQINREHQAENEQKEERNAQALEGRALANAASDLQRQITDLNDVKNQRLQALRRMDQNSYDGVMWLRKNRHLFTGQVSEPVFLEIDLKDPRHANALQHTLSFAIQKTFVFEKNEDYKTFGREFNDKMRTRVNIGVSAASLAESRQKANPPRSEEIKKLGFDGYLLDLLTGSDLVLAYLCQKAWIHAIPIASKENVDLQALEKFREIRSYIVGSVAHRADYSRYGARARYTQTTAIRAHGSGWGRSADPEQRTRLDQKMKEKAQQTAEIEANVKGIEKKIAAIKAKRAELEKKKETLAEEKKAMSNGLSNFQRAKTQIDIQRRLLATELSKPSQEERKALIMQKLFKINLARMEQAQKLASATLSLATQRASLDEAELKKMHAKSALRRTVAMHSRLANAIEDAKEDYAAAQKYMDKMKEKAAADRADAMAQLDNASAEVREQFDRSIEEHESRSVDEIEEEYQAMTDQLEVARGISPDIMRIFNVRKTKILDLQANLDEGDRALQIVEKNIARIRSKWEPALESIVADVNAKFSSAFARFDNAGEVQLNREEDFEKWGIHILVKFRENEALTLLTGQRQSGGERSLSTVMYIISLLGLSVSPFSLVDEINQGMDQRAERKVHDQMIEATCDGKAGQYFLITPKLLSDLRYDPMMKVLVINNGDWIPDKFDAREYIQRKRQALAARN